MTKKALTADELRDVFTLCTASVGKDWPEVDRLKDHVAAIEADNLRLDGLWMRAVADRDQLSTELVQERDLRRRAEQELARLQARITAIYAENDARSAEVERLRASLASTEKARDVAVALAKEDRARIYDRAERAERALKRAGFEDRGGEEWVPPVIPAETKIATFPGEFVSWHELTDRARHMFAYSKVVLTAQQVRALENDVAAFTNGASRPRMVGLTELLKDMPCAPACVHGVYGPRCSMCPDGMTQFPVGVSSVARGESVLSARDEFAKAAMQAAYVPTSSDATREEVARRAYAMADAMLKARGG